MILNVSIALADNTTAGLAGLIAYDVFKYNRIEKKYEYKIIKCFEQNSELLSDNASELNKNIYGYNDFDINNPVDFLHTRIYNYTT